MGNLIRILVGVILLLGIGCSSDNEFEPQQDLLSQQEIDDIFFLREEEKLAHDVYLYATQRYGLSIFNNISNGEKTHMDKVFQLISKYNLTDPALKEIGKFSNPEIQILYNDFTAKVDLSIIDALKVGATIEDLDISDLENNMSNTTRDDLLSLYESLQRASKNHMRAFTSLLNDYDTIYRSQFLSQDQYDEIITGAHTHCGK